MTASRASPPSKAAAAAAATTTTGEKKTGGTGGGEGVVRLFMRMRAETFARNRPARAQELSDDNERENARRSAAALLLLLLAAKAVHEAILMMPMGATHTRPEASAGSPRARARLFAESIVHTREKK